VTCLYYRIVFSSLTRHRAQCRKCIGTPILHQLINAWPENGDAPSIRDLDIRYNPSDEEIFHLTPSLIPQRSPDSVKRCFESFMDGSTESTVGLYAHRPIWSHPARLIFLYNHQHCSVINEMQSLLICAIQECMDEYQELMGKDQVSTGKGQAETDHPGAGLSSIHAALARLSQVKISAEDQARCVLLASYLASQLGMLHFAINLLEQAARAALMAIELNQNEEKVAHLDPNLHMAIYLHAMDTIPDFQQYEIAHADDHSFRERVVDYIHQVRHLMSTTWSNFSSYKSSSSLLAALHCSSDTHKSVPQLSVPPLYLVTETFYSTVSLVHQRDRNGVLSEAELESFRSTLEHSCEYWYNHTQYNEIRRWLHNYPYCLEFKKRLLSAYADGHMRQVIHAKHTATAPEQVAEQNDRLEKALSYIEHIAEGFYSESLRVPCYALFSS
jgi:hypothetical protein